MPAVVFPQCSLGGWASAVEREPADPDASRLEDGDGARVEVVGDCLEVREQKRRLLLGPSLGASTEQDEGRTLGAACREERREIGVGGNEDPVFCGGAVEDLLVGC